MEQLIATLTNVILSISILLAFYMVVKRVSRGVRITRDFTAILLLFIAGWLFVEIMEDFKLGIIVSIIHLSVMLLIAAFITIRWRRVMEKTMHKEEE